MSVLDLISRGCLSTLKGVVSSGKESRVYLGRGAGGEDLAVKIYLTLTSEFRRSMVRYIAGDPRFEGYRGLSPKKLLYLWARKEYSNLERLSRSGVRVPEPRCLERNVLVMEFIGRDGVRAPLLKEAYEEGVLSEEDLERIYREVLRNLETMVLRAGLVHGDLSEYNIMIHEGALVIIDVSQAVTLKHPNALDLLRHDVANISRFFSKAGIDVEDPGELVSRLAREAELFLPRPGGDPRSSTPGSMDRQG